MHGRLGIRITACRRDMSTTAFEHISSSTPQEEQLDTMSTPHPPSATGVVFSSAQLPETEKEKAQVTATVHAVADSTESSPAP